MRAGRATWRAGQRSVVLGRRTRSRRALAAGFAAVGIAAFVAACGTGGAAVGSGAQGDSSTATYAMPPGQVASYAFPFISIAQGAVDTVVNVNDFQYQMYRPLYWFGTGVTPYLNTELSLAYLPAYSGHTVTITMKPNYKWSNGESVDADDVVFFLNMMIAEQNNPNNAWDFSTPDGLPGDIADVRAVSKYVVSFQVTSPSFSQTWFTNNELSQITPMPMAWDRTAAGPSNCVSDLSTCNAVYTYLNAQSEDIASYGTSPIWQVVDGPWRVQSLTAQGNATLVFNTKYSGPVPAHHITKFIELPFTSESAEYNVLQDPTGSQTIDVGYLPTVYAPVPPAGSDVGTNPVSLSDYSLTVFYPWELSYIPFDYNNPKTGPIFSQQYIRTALQELIDQEGIIDGPLHGYGKVNYAPVSAYPVTSYLSPTLAKAGDPWKVNIKNAQALLQANGWVSNGSGRPDTCANPGSGPGECGTGVPAGAPLSFTLIYATGIDYMESASREFASNASLAGIQITLDPEPFDTVLGDAANPADTSWEMVDFGGFTFAPNYVPTGDTLFETGAGANLGSWSNSENDALITASLEAKTPAEFRSAMYAWEDYLAPKIPVLYMPNAASLVESIKGLVIGPQNSAADITPEMWYYK